MDEFGTMVKFLLILLGLFFMVVVPMSIYNIGKYEGAHLIASGQWQCKLVANQDKTTNWKCGEVE